MNEDLKQLVENSELWSKEYAVPCIPQHNNPHIYIAVVFKLLRMSGVRISEDWMLDTLRFQVKCYHELLKQYFRWPDRKGGSFSHDEIIGGAAISQIFARDCLFKMQENDGIYPDENGLIVDSRDFSRFIFLFPFLQSRVYNRVSLISQVKWSFHVVYAALMTSRESLDADGILKILVMSDEMSRYPLCDLAIKVWKIILNKRDVTLEYIFGKFYLVECPTILKICPKGKFVL